MEKNYEVGTGDSPISLEVVVGTVGVAYSEFSRLKGSDSSGTIASSKPRSGNIEKTAFGTASDVQGSSVFIRTLINFSHLTKAQRESALSGLVIEYKHDGGLEGCRTYTFDKDTDLVVTPNLKIVSVTAKIDLT